MVATDSLYWFDYETFGSSPIWDRPSQFAGLRTTLDLEPIGEPTVLYCRPSDDYLPHPEAVRITGQTPQEIAQRGVPEREFMAAVLSHIGAPGTCSVGYNSIRFDDEVTRHSAFRNFLDPYEHEWRNGNSRWDLLDVVRLTRALRPDGIEWPVLDDGTPSNRLEHLSASNGIEHSNAHDALADVYATLAIARLIRKHQPKLYDYAFTHRSRDAVAQLLNVRQRQVCVQVSGMVPAQFAHTALVLPLTRHPEQKTGVIVWDLHQDPDELLGLSADEIAHRLFTPQQELGNTPRLSLRTVRTNRCPVIVPQATLRAQDAERLGMDLELQQRRADTLQKRLSPELISRIEAAHRRPNLAPIPDLDGTLYSGGFLSETDRRLSAELRSLPPERLAQHIAPFDDSRLDELRFRYRARNYPEHLDTHDQERWRRFCRARLLDPVGTNDKARWLTWSGFEAAMAATSWHAEQQTLAHALEEYANALRDRLEAPVTT